MDNRTNGHGAPRRALAGAGGPVISPDSPHISHGRVVVVMVSVLLGILLTALDQTIVGPALPRIIGDLKGFEHYSWVVTVYLLTSTISVPIFGKLSDMYGRKWFFIAGVAVFLLGSGLSGLSGEVLPLFGMGTEHSGIFELIAFRGIQGLGGGIMMANAFAIVADLIPPAERGKWQGMFGGVFGLASVLGPTIGGFLTDNWGWRWVFYVNLPIGLVTLAVLLSTFPAGSTHTAKKIIDWWGAGTLVASLTPLLLALSLGGTAGWEWGSSRIITLLAAAGVFLAAFIFVETRAQEPIIPFDMFKNRIFTSSVLAVFFVGIGMFGAVIYIPLFIQAVQGDSATSSGNTVTPLTFAMVVSSVIAGQLISRTGKYRLLAILGMGLVTLGMFLLSTIQIDTQRLQLIAYMVVMGLGMGITFPLFTLAVQNAFPIQRVGVVTATLQFFRSIGSTVGVAVLGTLVNNTTASRFGPEFTKEMTGAGVPADFVQRLLSGLGNLNPQVLVSKEGLAQLHASLAQFIPAQFASFIPRIEAGILAAMKPALFAGIRDAFLVGTVMVALGLVATVFLKEIPLRRSNHRPAAVPAEGGEGFTSTAEEAGREMAAGGMTASELDVDEEPELARSSG